MCCTTSTTKTSLLGLIVKNNVGKMEENSLHWKPTENGNSLRKKFKTSPIQQITSGSSAWEQDMGKEKPGNGSLDNSWPTHTGKITNRQGMGNVWLLLRSTQQEHTGNIMTWAAWLPKHSFANSKSTQPQVTALYKMARLNLWLGEFLSLGKVRQANYNTFFQHFTIERRIQLILLASGTFKTSLEKYFT